MGRKSNSKHSAKKTVSRESNKFIIQKRKELSGLVDRLLKLTSVFHGYSAINKSWEHLLEILELLKEINFIEQSIIKTEVVLRKANIESYLKWLSENGANFEGVEITEFDGYELGLKAVKEFKENAPILTVPFKVMMSEIDAQKSELSTFIAVDPLLQNMPNIKLALFLLLEKHNSESFWKPYINMLPESYSTILYFMEAELSELRPSPVFEASLKLYRSIARQYAYFYNKIHTLDLPVLKKLQDVFTFESYRWAVSTVMTRQNNIQFENRDVTAFIPLWDMCNHEQGKITTDFNKELQRGECYALRDFKPGEQIFIFYGARSNADLFLHNGFVYPNNQHDYLTLTLGVSASDPLRETKLSLLSKLGLAGVTHFTLYKGDTPISAELLAFIRIFNMNKDELAKWSSCNIPAELVSQDATSAEAVGVEVDTRAYTYLRTRCFLLRSAYKETNAADNLHRKNIKLLKDCEVQILESAIKYLDNALQKLTIKAE